MKLKNIVFLGVAGVAWMTAGEALAADAAKGEKIAKSKCGVCHTVNQGGKIKLGPNLFGILGKRAGSDPVFKYSTALKASKLVWDEVTFAEFITKPRRVIRGTKMSFGGLKKASQRADVLAYFRTLSKTIPASATSGDVEAGRIAAVKHCQTCHSFGKGGKMVFGPNLFDIYGKPAGKIKGYKYSKALAGSGLSWTDTNLSGFLADPERFLKGNKANFPGIKSAKMRVDVIAYLKSLK